MGEKEINITYETLFELLRREKGREELQELNAAFFQDVIAYLKEKNEILADKEKNASVDEVTKLRIQISSVNRILKELYERREKKIIDMAIAKERTSSDFSAKSLLPEEMNFYNELVIVLTTYKENILGRLLDMKLPHLAANIPPKPPEPEPKQEPKEEKTEEKPVEAPKTTITVKFTGSIASFVDENLNEYGPYEEGDIAELPINVAEILIKKEKAIKQSN